MRQHPVGTGPFKFVEFKLNSTSRSRTRITEEGLAPLDGIEYTIVPNCSTAILGVAGQLI
jgi:peptide/nickel transport system substrate-binding protein